MTTNWTNLEKLIYANNVFNAYVSAGNKPHIGVRVLAEEFIDGHIGVGNFIDRFNLVRAAEKYHVKSKDIRYDKLAAIMNNEIQNLYKKRLNRIAKDLKSIDSKLDNRFKSNHQVKSSPKMKVTVTVTYEL